MGANKTVLLSTHIMQEVDKMCSRVVVINKGNIIDDQNIDALRKKDIDLENYFKRFNTIIFFYFCMLKWMNLADCDHTKKC